LNLKFELPLLIVCSHINFPLGFNLSIKDF